MPCNCNRENPTCEPCAICTPPGVTDLPVCTPVDICENSPVNMDCVTYSGEDFECLNVTNGDSLISVMLNILNVYFPEEYCCALEGTVEYITTTTTTTTTSTTTTSTSTTTTSTSTTTSTTTVAPIPYDCCIPFVSTMEGPALYNRATNTVTLVGIPGFSTGKAIANTRNKLWAPTTTVGEIKEWNFTQIPFSATASRTIYYDDTLYSIYSLFAINNTTLIGIDYSNPTTSRVVSIDITTTTAVVTVLFSLPAGRVASGNPIYTLAGNLVILNTISTVTSNTYITQYSDLAGTLDLEILVSNNLLRGIFDCANAIYITDSSTGVFIIDPTFPYSQLELTPSASKVFLSTSTSRDCLKLDFTGSGTVTTTTTPTPSNRWIASNNGGVATGNLVCFISTGGPTLYSNIPAFTGGTIFYTDIALTIPYNGQNWYHKITNSFSGITYYAKIKPDGTIAGPPDTSGTC